MSKPRLDGKVAIVTGGASGIGRIGAAAARLFASSGATVVIADVQDELGEAVALSAGARCRYVRCDVTDEAQVEAAVAGVVAEHRRLDVMLSNAGVLLPTGSVMDMDLAQLDRVMAVNFRGAAACVKHAARACWCCRAPHLPFVECFSKGVKNRGGAEHCVCTVESKSTSLLLLFYSLTQT